MSDFLEALRGNIQEAPDSTNLHFTREEFEKKILAIEGGADLLKLLAFGEWKICERLGLLIGYEKEEVIVPRWNNFITHLTIVYEV